jgi:hypothetical protein
MTYEIYLETLARFIKDDSSNGNMIGNPDCPILAELEAIEADYPEYALRLESGE